MDDEVYFAHSYPYTYTDMNRQLKTYVNDSSKASFLRLEMMAQTLGKLPVPMLTITENVKTFLEYPEELRLYNKMPTSIRKQLRLLYKTVFQLVLQSKQLKGDSRKMLLEIVNQEVQKFYEQHKVHLCDVDPAFEGFDARLAKFVTDHS